MRRVVSLLILCQLIVVSVGCGTGNEYSAEGNERPGSAARLNGVAVVDLDGLAKKLGMDAVLAKHIKTAETSLNEQLGSLQKSLRDQYTQKQEELELQPPGNGVSPEGAPANQELAGFERQLTVQLLQARRKAQGEFNTYRQRLLQGFRMDVVPLAQEIAAERGLGVVLTKNDAVVLAFDGAHDITDALAERMRDSYPPKAVEAEPVAEQASQAARPDPSGPRRR